MSTLPVTERAPGFRISTGIPSVTIVPGGSLPVKQIPQGEASSAAFTLLPEHAPFAQLSTGTRAGTLAVTSIESPSVVWFATDGTVALFSMTGTAWNGGVATVLNIPSPWKLVAAGDLNGDDNPDLIWEATGNGTRAVTYMHGGAYAGSYDMLWVIPPEWRIVASVDFNADNNPDIVLNNTVTGDNGVLYLNGKTWTGVFAPLPHFDPSLRVAAVGDMNGDTKPDLITQNTATGQPFVYFLNGTSVTSSEAVTVSPGAEWAIASVADFDLDGKNDLVFQNTSTGQRTIWLMNGVSRTSEVVFFNVSMAWTIVATPVIHWSTNSLAINAGNNQTASVGSSLPIPPSVKVTDANSNPVSGVVVTFTVTAGGGGLAGGVQTTDAAGIATVGSWTLGASAGANTLRATAQGVAGSPLNFTATSATSNSQRGVDHTTVTTKRIAVFVIDFPDTPDSIKTKYFPTTAAIRDTIFNGQIRSYFADMSYGQFTLTGDVFGYFTHQNPGFVNGAATQYLQVTDISTINIPGFDVNSYDGFAFVSVNDAQLAQGITVYNLSFKVNGISYVRPSVFVPIHIGYPLRDPAHRFFTNSMNAHLIYDIPIGTDAEIGGTTTMPASTFDRTFVHEFIHFLGLFLHANSRTNGASYDYQPEIPNNSCQCYGAGDPKNDMLDFDYGNLFDVMGRSYQGMSLNMVYRDFLGWTNATNRYTVKDYGHFTATLSPVNSLSGVRTVEIRIPLQFGDFTSYKNKGYFLEVRTGSNKWDSMMSEPQLHANNDGIMVLKTDGFNSRLLDVSPSPNISFFGQVLPDLRDVVLKPGMTYNNGEIRLSNVRKIADGTFAVDIDVLSP